MERQFTFSVDDREYSINNYAYNDQSITGELFQIKKCAVCQTRNSPFDTECCKCKSPLNADASLIGYRDKRRFLGILLGAVIWGVIDAVLEFVFRVRLGGIPVALGFFVCCFFFERILGNKVVIGYAVLGGILVLALRLRSSK